MAADPTFPATGNSQHGWLASITSIGSLGSCIVEGLGIFGLAANGMCPTLPVQAAPLPGQTTAKAANETRRQGRLGASQAWSRPKLAKVPRRKKILILVACALVTFFVVLAPPLHQSGSYHDFADRRTIFDIPDFWDVISNSLFLVIGLMGVYRCRGQASRILFFGVFCTSLGSAYYHLAPDNARLFWDRLPMTIAFMALFAIAIKQRKLTIPLVLLGIGSVIWWRVTDNLWPYGFVQFGTMAALLVIAARSEPGLWPVFIFYGLSKISEHFDRQIFSTSPLSGHTIKHLLAGIATLCIYRWIRASRSSLIMGDTESRFDSFREPVGVLNCPKFADRSSSNEFPAKEAW